MISFSINGRYENTKGTCYHKGSAEMANATYLLHKGTATKSQHKGQYKITRGTCTIPQCLTRWGTAANFCHWQRNINPTIFEYSYSKLPLIFKLYFDSHQSLSPDVYNYLDVKMLVSTGHIR